MRCPECKLVEMEVKQVYPQEGKFLFRCRRCNKEIEKNIEIKENNNLDIEESET